MSNLGRLHLPHCHFLHGLGIPHLGFRCSLRNALCRFLLGRLRGRHGGTADVQYHTWRCTFWRSLNCRRRWWSRSTGSRCRMLCWGNSRHRILNLGYWIVRHLRSPYKQCAQNLAIDEVSCSATNHTNTIQLSTMNHQHCDCLLDGKHSQMSLAVPVAPYLHRLPVSEHQSAPGGVIV